MLCEFYLWWSLKLCFSWVFTPYNHSVEPSYMTGLSASEHQTSGFVRFFNQTNQLLSFLVFHKQPMNLAKKALTSIYNSLRSTSFTQSSPSNSVDSLLACWANDLGLNTTWGSFLSDPKQSSVFWSYSSLLFY